MNWGRLIINYPDPKIKFTIGDVYSPSDDSYLIIDYLKDHITRTHFDSLRIENVNNILDMGTGSGIVAIFLLSVKKINQNFSANIYASDIDQNAIDSAKANEKSNGFNNRIKYIHSDLFKSFPPDLKHGFDIIFFNPPYLPSIVSHRNLKRNSTQDYTWEGGEKGFEIILNFVKEAKKFLRKENRSYIYYVCSSKTNLLQLYERISQLGFKNKIVNKNHIFFEDLFLNRLEKNF